jgi:acetyl esterase
MPVDPRLVPVLVRMNAARRGFGAAGQPATATPVDGRAESGPDALADSLAEPVPQVASIVDHRVPVAGGAIAVRVYTPFGSGPFPAHLFMHGGGFWLGTLDQTDGRCRTTAAAAGCVVVSVGYRLAPAFRFPTAPRDCLAALHWLGEHASELDVDATRISIGGASAGANLATVVALMVRDHGGPPLVLQVLETPVTDLTLSFPSIDEFGAGYGLTKDGCGRSARLYLGDGAPATDPYASPYFADDLSRLPRAVVLTAECDPVRDEGEAYARRLDAAGVAVLHRRMAGHIHGALAFTRLLPSAREYRDLVHAQLRAAYADAGQSES